MTLGAGYEFWHGSGNFAMDVQGRLSQAAIGGADLTSFAVMVGMNWY